MNRIINYLSQYFGNEDFSYYPRSPRNEKSENLSLALDRANCMHLDEADSKTCPDFIKL